MDMAATIEEVAAATEGVGTRSASEEVWRQARDDYLAGHSAAEVCETHDIGKSTFWARAAAEGWRRRDQSESITVLDDPELENLAGNDLAEMARNRLAKAMVVGRAAEAAGWLRIYEEVRFRATRDDQF